MGKAIQSIRGMHDIIPDVAQYYQTVQACAQRVLTQFGYKLIILPCLEQTVLFSRGVGEITDIFEKEMYTFTDRNGDRLSLRPEGTAGCVRACIQNALLDRPQRLWWQC